jgi:hypothetical protein
MADVDDTQLDALLVDWTLGRTSSEHVISLAKAFHVPTLDCLGRWPDAFRALALVPERCRFTLVRAVLRTCLETEVCTMQNAI